MNWLAIGCQGQWQLLAVLQATLSVWLFQATQQDPSTTLLALVVWGGAALCIEDQLVPMRLNPSQASLLAGLTLLAYGTWRSSIVLHLDAMVYLLPVLQGLGLALLARPVRQLPSFWPALMLLALFPIQFVVFKLLPDYGLSVATGQACQVLLALVGVDAFLSGRMLQLDRGSVEILAACNGAGQIVHLAVIGVIFVLAYPIRSRAGRLATLVLAPFIGFWVNAARISLLALINSSELTNRQQLFDWIHDEWGGLLFSALATFVLGQIYLVLVNRQLAEQDG